MQIIAGNGIDRIREYDRILRRLLTEREQEWQGQRGFRRLFIRLKIELWAWWEAQQELGRILRND